jgi:Uma2 family endonuclease
VGACVDERGLGYVFGPDAGAAVWPGRRSFRRPGVTFVRRGRLPSGLTSAFLSATPDLAAEVVSPNDEAGRLEAKIEDYRDAGIPLVWVVYRETRTAGAHRGQRVELVDTDGVLDGGDVLSGFRLPLAELFVGL